MNKYLFDKNQIVTDINLVTIMAPDVETTLNHPDRPNHGFAYAISSTVEYIFDDGTRLMCSPRNLIYLPEHRSYYIKKHESGYTACINFKLLNDTEIYMTRSCSKCATAARPSNITRRRSPRAHADCAARSPCAFPLFTR